MGVSAVASGQMEAFWSPRTYLLMETMLAGHPAVEMAFGTSNAARSVTLARLTAHAWMTTGTLRGTQGTQVVRQAPALPCVPEIARLFGMAPDLQIELDTYRVTTREKQCSRSQRPL